MENNIDRILSSLLQGRSNSNASTNNTNLESTLTDIFTNALETMLTPEPISTTSNIETSSIPEMENVPTMNNDVESSPSILNSSANARILDLIDDTMHVYNRNIRDYQQNMQIILETLQRIANQPQRMRRQRSAPIRNIGSTRSTAGGRSNAQVTQDQDDNSTVLFTYYYYPDNVTARTGQNTQVALTRDEVSRTTRTYGFTENMLIQPTNGETDENANRCPITLDTFQPGDVVCEILGCGHIFKRPALMNWLRRNTRCPMCRYRLLDYLTPPMTTGSRRNIV